MFARRLHMFLALFLMPWMFVYAWSTIAMNHREKITGLKAKTFSGDRAETRLSEVLERIHKRVGAGNRTVSEYAWFVTVDLAAAGIVLWVITGFWMFLKIHSARMAGMLLLICSGAIFLLFLVMI